MLKCGPAIRRLVVYLLLGIGLALGVRDASAQSAGLQPSVVSPLRIPNLPIGAHCFGLNPCTFIDAFGLRLRTAALVVFRPETGHDRDFYAARIQIAPSITLMQWAEVGVALPITLYSQEVGVSAVYEPLQPFARVRLPLESLLGGVATTAYVRVHIASGPFVGGLPPLGGGGQPAMPDLLAQAIAAYRPQTQFEAGLAVQKRIGPVSATGSIGAAVSAGRLEVYGGGELAYHFSIVNLFIQGQGIGVPRCPHEEAALNFCARGFRFGAGARFDWDLGAGGMMVATGSGAVEPGWEVGGQFGLDYDETTRRRHGDGVDAAHAFWDRRFDAMARGWAAWKSAATVWQDEEEALRRAQAGRRGPFSDVLGGAAPPPSSPWLDGLLGEDAPPPLYPLFPEEPGGAKPLPLPAPPGRPILAPQAQKGQPARHGPPRRSLFAEANARAAAQRQLGREPRFALPGSLELMTDDELAKKQWQVQLEEQRRAEAQQWRESPPLPPIEKPFLNWAATWPMRLTLGMLAVSGPGRRAEAEEQLRQLRPIKCTPAEEAMCDATEQMLDSMATVLVPSAAEAAAARQTVLAIARQGARETAHAAEFMAAEQSLGLAEETSTGATEVGASGFWSQVRDRLNPMNYEVRGMGSNFGNLRYRGPRPTDIQAVAEHEVPALVPQAEESASLPSRHTAFEQAKKDLNIPRSQQPSSVGHRDMETRSGKKILDSNGEPIRTREYYYTTSDGEEVIIQEHSAGHVFRDKDGMISREGPHFNVRPVENPRNGTVEGTKPHYPFKK